MNPKYDLYLVTDRRRMTAATLAEAVEEAILGGCTMIQLREPFDKMGRDGYTLAEEIKQVTDRYDVPLIINDRLDLALALDAAGVHMGQSDLPAAAARRLLGRDKLLGISVTTLAEARQAEADGADYLGVGAIFPSETKPDAKPVSLDVLETIRKEIRIPLVAIGGITRDNAALLRQMGVDGLAVVSAILSRPDIRSAARELKEAFLGSR